MAELRDKLQLKGRAELVVVGAPPTFAKQLDALGLLIVSDRIPDPLEALLAFATRQAEVDALSGIIAKQTSGDALIWIAYPKLSSKQFKCDFNRDTGWAELNANGFETVRAIAIDDDWTGLRFRRREFIKARS